MYSQGKRLLEEEKAKANKVPTELVEKHLSPENLGEKARIINELLESLGPLAEAKLKQSREEEVVKAEIKVFSTELTKLAEKLGDLALKLDELIDSKNVNAELERRALNNIIAITE